MSDTLRNSSAELRVDISKIINNYQTLASHSSSVTCSAVVKANAYGLGLSHVAPALYHNTDCDTFFVANLVEAIELRTLLKEPRIYVFNGLFADEIDTYLEHNITPFLNDLSQVALWCGRAEPCGIHFDTGINRLGLTAPETEQFLNENYPLNLSLAISHLVRSDELEHPTNAKQLEKFKKINGALPNTRTSLCNSAGIYLGSDYHFDMV
ncbi:MAG: alanine racemase, partial [Emcibacteraceae bacterium]|nr:alanine racemase [Emcibacteraceae bacterium]